MRSSPPSRNWGASSRSQPQRSTRCLHWYRNVVGRLASTAMMPSAKLGLSSAKTLWGGVFQESEAVDPGTELRIQKRLWCKFTAWTRDACESFRISSRQHRGPDGGRRLALHAQTTQVELTFADAMQQSAHILGSNFM